MLVLVLFEVVVYKPSNLGGASLADLTLGGCSALLLTAYGGFLRGKGGC